MPAQKIPKGRTFSPLFLSLVLKSIEKPNKIWEKTSHPWYCPFPPSTQLHVFYFFLFFLTNTERYRLNPHDRIPTIGQPKYYSFVGYNSPTEKWTIPFPMVSFFYMYYVCCLYVLLTSSCYHLSVIADFKRSKDWAEL